MTLPRIHHFAEIDSTQDEALRRLDLGDALPFAVMADQQTKGRGRQGRAWESPVGNLSATVALPLGGSDRAGHYSFIVAVAMHAAIAGLMSDPSRLQLKWPNDLMLDGIKCGGILLEVPTAGILLIGTGINLAHAPADRSKVNDYTAAPVTPDVMINAYLERLDHYVARYHTEGLGVILTQWVLHARGIGEMIEIRLPYETFSARFTGIAPDGALIATMPNGDIRFVHAGEVFFI